MKHSTMPPRSAATIAASAGIGEDPGYGSLVPPVFVSDTYRWHDAHNKPAYDYSRTINPNRDMLCTALSELEGAEGGAITGSGQSATLLALLMLPAGARVVAPHDCYGGTYRLMKGLEEQGKLHVTFVNQGDDAAFADALSDAGGPPPALVWLETPSNPLLRIVDIADRAAKAKAAGALVIADNTLPTPVRQRPLDLGCDLVMHSTTKALNGHGDLFGGALMGRDAALIEKLHWWSNAAGLSESAYDAWLALRGMRTLPLRIDRQEATARRIAEWLAGHDKVTHVNYPGLDGFAGKAVADRQMLGPGFMLSFGVDGGGYATTRFLEQLRLITLASSLGGFATLICVPATMTHRGMPLEAQAEAGLGGDLLRLSVGLEEADDLLADLERGFAAL